MSGERPSASNGTGQVLSFRRPAAGMRLGVAMPAVPQRHSPVEDTGKYERSGREPDDYAHRMMVNLMAVAVLVVLIGAGIWLAIKIAELRRDQDCVLSGRRNCAQISIIGNSR